MAEAIGGDLVEQLGQLLAQAREIGFRRQRPRAVGLAVVLVGVDEVDVGTEIEFLATELAQPEHHQPLRAPPSRRADHAVALRELAFQRLQCRLQAVFGQARAAGQGVARRRRARAHRARSGASIPPRGSDAAAPASRCARSGSRASAAAPRSRRRRRSVSTTARLAHQRVDREVAGDGHAAHFRRRLRTFKQCSTRRRSATQALQRAIGDGGQVGILHRGDCGMHKCMRPLGRPHGVSLPAVDRAAWPSPH